MLLRKRFGWMNHQGHKQRNVIIVIRDIISTKETLHLRPNQDLNRYFPTLPLYASSDPHSSHRQPQASRGRVLVRLSSSSPSLQCQTAAAVAPGPATRNAIVIKATFRTACCLTWWQWLISEQVANNQTNSASRAGNDQNKQSFLICQARLPR